MDHNELANSPICRAADLLAHRPRACASATTCGQRWDDPRRPTTPRLMTHTRGLIPPAIERVWSPHTFKSNLFLLRLRTPCAYRYSHPRTSCRSLPLHRHKVTAASRFTAGLRPAFSGDGLVKKVESGTEAGRPYRPRDHRHAVISHPTGGSSAPRSRCRPC